MNLPRKVYHSRNEQIIDFVLGFVGWFVINIIMAVAGQLLGAVSAGLISSVLTIDPDTADVVMGVWLLALTLVPLLVNIGALLLLAFTRYWAALGALAAFAVSLLMVICAGLFVLAGCFVILSQYAQLGPLS